MGVFVEDEVVASTTELEGTQKANTFLRKTFKTFVLIICQLTETVTTDP